MWSLRIARKSDVIELCVDVILLQIALPLGLGLRIIPPERLLKERLYQPGDYIIGGLFPVHFGVTDDRKLCTNFSEKGLSWLQAFLFAIDTINKDTQVLPNITLGYDVRDDCNQVDRAVEAAYDFISGRKFLGRHSSGDCAVEPTAQSNHLPPIDPRHRNCLSVTSGRRPSVTAVVGSASSVISATVANIFGVENMPQISYAATSRWLSDKKRYRSFFRTIPSDDLQVKVIVDLLHHFNWTYLSTLATDSVYGELSAEEFQEEIKQQKICLAVRHVLPSKRRTAALKKFVTRLQRSEEGMKSSVVLGFLPEHEAPSLLREISRHQLNGKTFIASESWADMSATLEQPPEVVQGMLGITSSRGTVPGYSDYLRDISEEKLLGNNPWLKAYLEEKLNCHFKSSGRQLDCSDVLERNRSLVITNTFLMNGKVSNVVDAVYAIAHALHNLLCNSGSCEKRQFAYRDLSQVLRDISFQGCQRKVSFDRNGDVTVAKYVITNVQKIGDRLQYVDVGSWNGALNVADHKFVWNNGSSAAPISACSEDCSPGYRILYSSSKCCWACVLCDEGAFTNSTNQEVCLNCKEVFGKGWTNNTNNTSCVELPLEYLTWDDTLAIAASVISLLLFVADVFCLGVFVKYRETPVVKGSNRELTFLLLVFLGLCFLNPFLYIGRPNDILCKVQPNVFGFVYTICISVMFTKTRRILMVFTAKMSSLSAIHSDRRRSEQKQVLLLVTMTLVEGSIVGMSTYLMSPKVTFDYSKPHSVIVDCGTPWLTIHLIAMSYTCLIAIVCTFLAFKARKLPEAFNEARSISFTMFVMILVWIGSIPAYLESYGKARTAWFCFSATFAALPKLLFLIVPKVRIILFHPEKNRADVVRSQTTNHILTKAVRRTSSVSIANSGSQSAQLRRRSNTAGSTDSGTVMIHPRKHGKAKRQVSSTESQMDSRRFSDLSERSGTSEFSEPRTVTETDMDITDKKSTLTEFHVSSDTKL